MLKINKVVITGLLVVSQLSLWAQNNTNSPYTRFGYGELADRSFGAGRAMGGVGYGLRSSKQINPLNPASYSCMDSLTFLFDFGASGQVSWFYDGINRQKNVNGNVEYIAMQFPVTRRIAVSLGLLPFSYVGYEFGKAYPDVASPYTETFVGKGSLSDAYAGIGVDLWKNRLSVGANFGFLFGNVTHERNLEFYKVAESTYNNVYYARRVEVRDLKMDFGIQYTHPLGKRESLTLGFTYSPGKKLNTDSYDAMRVGNDATTDTITGQRFDIPNSFGFGASFVKEDKLTLAADFLFENWEKCQYFSKEGEFKNRMRVAGGVEYIPDNNRKAFFQRVRYRAGFHYSNSYLNVNQLVGDTYERHRYNEMGASVGLGLPLVDSRSFLNISFEYTKVHPEVRTMIDEQHFRFTVNYTFNELWFFKRKVD